MLTHNHHCVRYCDRMGTHSDECDLPYDISKYHDCPEHIARRKSFFAAMNGGCKYGCSKPCSHPPKEKERDT